MEFTRHLSLLTLALLTALALYGHLADACMCEPMHPQGHYCKADYGEYKSCVKQREREWGEQSIKILAFLHFSPLTVVLLRVVRKSKVLEPGNVVYKVQIKRTYKVSWRL